MRHEFSARLPFCFVQNGPRKAKHERPFIPSREEAATPHISGGDQYEETTRQRTKNVCRVLTLRRAFAWNRWFAYSTAMNVCPALPCQKGKKVNAVC